jgi:assimilatory nitrate reductase catalytic subunit
MNDSSTPRFLQGVFPFQGAGLTQPIAIGDLTYTVPPGASAQPVYFRGGNSSADLIYVVLLRDGKPMRYFPIGAKSGTHVSLRVVEDLLSDTVLELAVAAPEAVHGTVVVDTGLIEI